MLGPSNIKTKQFKKFKKGDTHSFIDLLEAEREALPKIWYRKRG